MCNSLLNASTSTSAARAAAFDAVSAVSSRLRSSAALFVASSAWRLMVAASRRASTTALESAAASSVSDCATVCVGMVARSALSSSTLAFRASAAPWAARSSALIRSCSAFRCAMRARILSTTPLRRPPTASDFVKVGAPLIPHELSTSGPSLGKSSASALFSIRSSLAAAAGITKAHSSRQLPAH
eukprot:scaffold13582_cov22-Tisochrysis_lutea.AAC.7